MKKIAITLMVVLAAVLCAACANYTEEFNAALDSYNQQIDSYESALDKFNAEIGYADITEDIEKLCSDLVIKGEETAASASAYLEEIKGYEKGIKDKELFQSTVSNIEDYSVQIQSKIDSIPAVEGFYVTSVEFHALMDEWEEKEEDFEDEMDDLDDLDDFQKPYDAMVKLDEETLAAVNGYIDTIAGYQEKLGDENAYNELKSEMDEAAELIQSDLDSMAELEVFFGLTKDFLNLSTAYDDETLEKAEALMEANSDKEVIDLLNEVLELNADYSKQMLDIVESLEEIKSETYKKEIQDTIDDIDDIIGMINESTNQINYLLGN